MNDVEYEIIKRVARHLAKKKYQGDLYEEGDLYAAGWLAVEEAHAKHGCEIDRPLLINIIRRRMIDHVRHLLKKNNDPVSNADNLTPSIISDLSYEASPIEDILSRDSFEQMIRCLWPHERNIARLYFAHDFHMWEIGEIMGITESAVGRQIRLNILPKIKESCQ